MPDGRDREGDERAAAGAVEHDAQRQQRVRGAPLDRDERAEQRDAGGEEATVSGSPQLVRLGVREAVDDGEQAARGGQHAGQVEARAVGVRRVGDERDRADGGRDREGEVDVHREAPGEVLGEDAAEQQADRAAGTGDGAEDAERACAVAAGRERRRQQRERGGREQRAEDALHGAGADEHLEALRCAADGGRGGEAEQAGDERPLAAEEVAELAAQQQQAAEGERVGRHDPLPRAVGEVQRVLCRGQRDVHDGGVEHDHQLRDAEHREDRPAPAGGRNRVERSGHRAVPSAVCDVEAEIRLSKWRKDLNL